jgi:hypothetical protein
VDDAVSRESDLAAVARRFPQWECWRGISGQYFARPSGTFMAPPVTGETPAALGAAIDRAERSES